MSLSDCILWTGPVNEDGYGKWGSKLAHRRVWENEVGPIPEGLELDHLCEVRLCINIKHLEPVTHAENLRRGRSHKWRLAITHCPAGHEYNEENTGHTVTATTVRRYCKVCKRIRNRAYRQKAA